MTTVRLRGMHPVGGPVLECDVLEHGGPARVAVGEVEVAIQSAPGNESRGWCTARDGSIRGFAVCHEGDRVQVWLDGRVFAFEVMQHEEAVVGRAGVFSGDVSAPMPGRVTRVMVEAGQLVSGGDHLIILESMKMELVIDAPGDGVVRRVAVGEGDLVDRGMRLVELEPGDGRS